MDTTSTIKNKFTCSICLEDIESNPVYTPCIHGFHEQCINKWIAEKKYDPIIKCPTCKYDISILRNQDNNNIYRQTFINIRDYLNSRVLENRQLGRQSELTNLNISRELFSPELLAFVRYKRSTIVNSQNSS